jgi:TP901 family phage tail tape measure protein
MPLLSPVIATLLADTKEYMAKMDEAELKMGKFGLAADASGTKFSKFTNSATTAVAGLGIAFTGFAVDSALKFNEALDKLQNQAGLTKEQADAAGQSILGISNVTGISSANIAAAYLQVSKAGIQGAAAQNLVTAAAKQAVVTGGDVAQTTQTLVGIQNLQIAKGMSVAAVSDLMVEANKRHLGSLDSLTSALTGKVGGALAAAGVSLAEIASVSDVASAAGYNNARSYTQLATGLNKIESPTTASAKAMEKLGINAQTLASVARHPGTGLVDTLQYLETVSKKTGVSMNTLISGTFGPGSVGLVSDLSNHIGALAGNVKALGAASGTGLNTAFGVASKQLDTQMKIIETKFVNSATTFGLTLIPYVQTAVNGITGAMNYLTTHPGAVSQIGNVLGAVFAGSLAVKAVNIGNKVAAAFGAEAEVLAGPIGLAIGTAALGLLETWSFIHGHSNPNSPTSPFYGFTQVANALGLNNTGPSGAPKGSGGYVNVGGAGLPEGTFILQNQLSELNSLVGTNKITQAQFNTAALNFANQDTKRNYTLTVNIK